VQRAQGFFIPSTTANHKFKLQALGEAQLHINPNGNDPAGKVS